MWAVVAACCHCFFNNLNLRVMAKGCNALGGSFRGRIGNVTCYVRHGQQIVYERIPRQEHRHVERHPGSSESMKYAQRWRKQLADEGVYVDLAALLEFYHSIVRVANGDSAEWLVDSVRGGWASSNVYVENGEVRSLAKARDAGVWHNGYLAWGGNEIEQSSFPTNCWWDTQRNVYPSGSLFCSIRGAIDDDLELVIGRRNDMPAKYRQQTNTGVGSSTVAAYYDGSYVITAFNRPGLPTPYDYIYNVQGWQAPNVIGVAATAYPFFIVNADGKVLVMAVLN